MKYIEFEPHKIDSDTETGYKKVTVAKALDRSRNVFAIRGRGKFKLGQEIELTNLYTHEPAGKATIIRMNGEYPITIQRADGTIEAIFGYIIELIPLLVQLWNAIKSLFKSK